MNARSIALLLTLPFCLLSGCHQLLQAPDPVKVKEQIDAYRQEELKLVQATIEDPARADRFLLHITRRDELISDSTEAIIRFRKQMWELNVDYNTPRESFETFVDEYNTQREMFQNQLVVVFGDMKNDTTPEEWKTISSFQQKRLPHRQLIYAVASEGD